MTTRRPSALRSGVAGERGDGGGSALMWALLVPSILLVVMLGVQVAQLGFARNLAQAAAEAGVRAAVTAPGDPSKAAPAARAFLADQTKSLQGVQVAVSSTGTSVTVTVTGTSPSLVPGITAQVSQSSSGPLERLDQLT